MLKKNIFLSLYLCLCAPALLPAQYTSVTVSGLLKNTEDSALVYAHIILSYEKDSSLVSGTVSGPDGRFSLPDIHPGAYRLTCNMQGYDTLLKTVFIGSLTEYLDLGTLIMFIRKTDFQELKVTARKEEVGERMDKKTFTLEKNISQSGGSVLQAMQNLPGVTIQDGKLMIRGSDQVIILIDGKQTALTGYGGQASLDNIPASAIERIEVINNPSSKYEANGQAGIINIIMKKDRREGFNGKAGLSTGLGALWIKRDNLPGIRPQYQRTPKMNPSLGFNYRKKNINVFFQGDILYNPTLNKNEFVTRTYDNGTIIRQQTKRNRNTTVGTARLGFDYDLGKRDLLTFSTLFSSEKILDNGDQPFFNDSFADRKRLWQFLEDEVKTTLTASTNYRHKYAEPGHSINLSANYTFHRENEKYFFTNFMPTFTGLDAFKLLSDEHVVEFGIDYIRPLKYGRLETGLKYRWRYIPTHMQFLPGLNSPLDTSAGGGATYSEHIPASYVNYIYEDPKFEIESGIRMEYVQVKYAVDPANKIYSSNGYQYLKPFTNLRFAYKINKRNKLSASYNRRVDRPNEFDIRVFPKYDDAEIIKVGNPALRPQYTNSVELGYKTSWKKAYLYTALYQRAAQGTMTRIASTVPGSNIIYSIMQNAGKSNNTGIECLFSSDISRFFNFNINVNAYQHTIDAFTIENKYPVPRIFHADKSQMFSGSAKFNGFFNFNKQYAFQLTGVYLAPDLIPQGKIGARFSLDIGLKKDIQKGKGQLFLNASDLLNTMVIRKRISADGFTYSSSDYYETQVVRIGYNYKF
jgi:outer membrane receptor protein involved in Fe transport